jgi:(p)ppGpp synthase/HD superfamily hydrolase
MECTVDLLRAMDLAARLHSGQTRKGPAGEPYVNHVVEVACLLAEATEGRDEILIMGALLHDVLEDAPKTPGERAALAETIGCQFGPDVLALVEEVTDAPSASEAERWRNQVEAAPHKSDRGKLLKIADKTSNLREIVRDPPPHWDRDHLVGYIEWGRDVVAGCRGLNAALEAAFDATYAEARAKYADD